MSTLKTNRIENLTTTDGGISINNSGQVGIGTTSPTTNLEINGGTNNNIVRIVSTDANANIEFADNTTTSGCQIGANGDNLKFGISGTEAMRIDSSGNVGIGTTSPSAELHVNPGSGNAGNIRIDYGTGSSADGYLNIEVGSGGVLYETVKSGGLAHIWYNTGAERMRIDSSGRVGIGDASPSSYDSGARNLVVGSSSDTGILIKAGTSSYSNLYFGDGTGSASYRGFVAYNHNGDSLRFGTAGSERMRITSGGFVGINNQNPSNYLSINGDGATPNIRSTQNPTSNVAHLVFSNNNGDVGTIKTSGSSTAYNTSSDYRLKENIVDIFDGITRVKQLAPKRFNFIADDTTTVDGFLAHEAQTVVPEAVTGTKDEVDENGNAVMQGIDQSKLVPLLTAALQEAIAKIETLEAEVAALKSN